MSERRQVHVVITGRVQRVWYRAWTGEEASDLGLDGWVRNRRDGSVEAVFAGQDGDVEKMLALCWQGPPLANVEAVVPQDDASSVEPGFRQLPTG